MLVCHEKTSQWSRVGVFARCIFLRGEDGGRIHPLYTRIAENRGVNFIEHRLNFICIVALILLSGLMVCTASAESIANSGTKIVPGNVDTSASATNIKSDAPFESQSIRRPSDTGRAVPNGATAPRTSSNQSGVWDFSKAVLSLICVIAVVLGMAWLWKMFLNGTRGQKSPGAIQVLSKTNISPRQSVMLMQVGRRLLVVGTGGTDMNTLCQIENPDEVSEMLAKVRLEKSAGNIGFRRLFTKAESQFKNDQTSDTGVSNPVDMSMNEDRPAQRRPVFKIGRAGESDAFDSIGRDDNNDIESLTERVRKMAEKFQKPK